MHYVNVVLDWIDAHPTIFALVIMPLIGAVVSWLGKPRTPEEFARMPYAVAQGLRLWAAIFPDPNKALKIISDALQRKGKGGDEPPTKPVLPPDPPSGAGGLGAMAIAFVLSVSLMGCTPGARREAGHAAVDAAGMACVIANAFLDVPAIKVACRIEDVADDFLHQLIDAARSRAKAGVPACAASGTCSPEALK